MDITRIEPVPVLCIIASEEGGGIRGAWQALESRFASLRGRKFYGCFNYPHGPYRACVMTAAGDSATALHLEEWTIPGGLYAREKLADWEADPDQIPETFGRMAEQCRPDSLRPSIEFYHSQKELILYLPVLPDG